MSDPWQSGGAAAPWQSEPPPPPAAGGGAPDAAIAVTAKYLPLAFILGAFKPHIAINGYPVPNTGWGRTVVSVHAGQHHVHVHTPYILPPRIGTADLTIAVHPGQTLELEYRAPLTAFNRGSLGSPPQKYRGMGVTVAMLVLSLVMGLCLVGGAFYAVYEGRDTDVTVSDPHPTTGPDLPSAIPPAPTTPGSEPTGSTPTTDPDEPTLKQTAVRRLVGPAFSASDKTYTMAFRGWPFAFRTPGTWGCISGKVDLPNATARVCIDEGNSKNRQRLNIMIRPCDNGCGAAERATLEDEWFDSGGTTKRGPDTRTRYLERSDDEGRYVLDFSHFFGDTPGGTPRWQVGVTVMAPPKDKAIVQKIANDILTQTP